MAVQQPAGMALSQLMQLLQLEAPLEDIIISGMAMDSRQVVEGDLFIACAGLNQHGIDHAQQAVAQGAVAVFAEVTSIWLPGVLTKLSVSLGVPVIPVSDLTGSVSELAGVFYGQPSRALPVIGITGTNGKTSCSHFIASVCKDDCKVGVMGTLGNGYPEELKPSTHTTMDPVSVQAQLALFKAEQAEMVAMEVSSHALKQSRVADVKFDTAVLTNFSRDHLDYHGTMADYASAKSLLFKMPGLKNAIINIDDELGAKLVSSLQGSKLNLMVYGREFNPVGFSRYLKAEKIQTTSTGIEFAVQSHAGCVDINLPLLGEFNVMNALVALAVLLNNGVTLQEGASRLSRLHTVNGRMQLVYAGNSPKTVIDFAHTPDALEQVLKALRSHVPGSLICIFGCGGDRDKGKRPLMGAIAEAYADKIFITDDNPRHEDAAVIVKEILKGIKEPDQVVIEQDRQLAICKAMALATVNDLILIAGKGHENYQIVGDDHLPFSDELAVKNCLREKQ